MSLDYVKKWYNSLPSHERDLPLIPLEGKTYTPKEALEEVKKGTPVGEKLQRKIESGSLSEGVRSVAKKRLFAILDRYPQDKPLVGRYLGRRRVALTPKKLKEEIKKNTETGQEFTRTEVERMQQMIERE